MKKRLDLILVEKKLVATRSKAQAMIMAGQIFVEDKKAIKSGELFNYNSNIEIKNLGPIWVSRGGIKLSHAIKKFNIEIKNHICMDIGASTGGFTDVLLKFGAKKIFAVDVGYNQLHEKLKKNNNVINLEKMNARYLDKDKINENIDLIVCDASFISMKKVLKSCLKFLNENGKVIALIKPQFEANKNEIKKGGVVKDFKIHKRICNDITLWFEKDCGFRVEGIIESPIKGPKGNLEYLIFAKKN